MNRFEWRVALCVAGLALLLGGVAPAFSQEISVVSPGVWANVEGDSSLDPASLGPFRFQQVFPASDFQSLPESHHSIVSMALRRPDATQMDAVVETWEDLQIRLSVTSAGPDDINTSFEANIGGAEQTLVYDGRLSLATENSGPPDGPKDFDQIFSLQDPFPYDPNQGNLLLDVVTTSGTTTSGPALIIDAFVAPTIGVAAIGDVNAMTGGPYGGAPMQFTFAPEPTTFDFNTDGKVDVSDIDMLIGEIVAGPPYDPAFDISGDAKVDDTDVTQWLSGAANHNGFSEAYLPGDANLDGFVSPVDLNNLALSWRQDVALWSGGDFTSDGVVDSADLNELALNWRQSIPMALSASAHVPEPSGLLLTVVGLALVWRRPRRR